MLEKRSHAQWLAGRQRKYRVAPDIHKGMRVCVHREPLPSDVCWPYDRSRAGSSAVAAVESGLAERRRRATLLELVRHAPAGTVVVQGEGRGGPAMSVQIGSRDGEGG
ncbi:hypothetical protein [Streptomyces olivochromogenes]|uniref:Uncharacterized protein n=1 Tax=Streptomyces olivochromogenes TaxID=1963 RepID=A0A286PGQ0_STROL|nr:hypothetical protein [Streptomyces olivochromogenes]GAX58729.1 hypothetical protein SO3561_10304 [Streptomyces olivochromogenes]